MTDLRVYVKLPKVFCIGLILLSVKSTQVLPSAFLLAEVGQQRLRALEYPILHIECSTIQ